MLMEPPPLKILIMFLLRLDVLLKAISKIQDLKSSTQYEKVINSSKHYACKNVRWQTEFGS